MSHELGVIFDVDGVLVDSYQAHFDSWLLVGRERGMEMTHEQFVATFGRTSREVIRQLWGDLISDDVEIANVDNRKEALFRELMRLQFPAMDGAVQLIDQLNAAGFRLAVGSSGPPENVELVLDALQRRSAFRGVITGRDVTRGKPDPQVFMLGAERLGLPLANCVVVEDAPAGITAAHAAGMACVGLASTGRTREALHEADLIVDSLRELDVTRIERLLDYASA
jgi:beta-phosphoglucomutase